MSAWKPTVCGRFDHLQQLDVALHAVHAAPADLPFGRQPLAVVLGDRRGLLERLGDLLRVALRILRPLRRARRRVDADDAVVADAEVAQLPGDARRPCAPASGTPCAPRRSPIADPPPVGGQTGATSEPTTRPFARILSASRFRSSSVESMLTCGSKRNRSTPSNSAAVRPRRGGQVEHRVEVDRRLCARAALADEARPHRVVESGFLVHLFACSCRYAGSGMRDPSGFAIRSHSAYRVPDPHLRSFARGASGLPGPKCFNITSGSDSLRFSMRMPALRGSRP